MKLLAIALFTAIALVLMFLVGIFQNYTALTVIGFCGWTPAMILLGYAIAHAGVKVTVQSSYTLPARQAQTNGASLPETATERRLKRLVNR